MPNLPDGPRKPVLGQPCNGCGLCCAAEACAIAVILIPGTTPAMSCPALEWEGGRSWCGMVRHPFKYSERAAASGMTEKAFGTLVSEDLGGVGGACDSVDNEWAGATAREYLEQSNA